MTQNNGEIEYLTKPPEEKKDETFWGWLLVVLLIFGIVYMFFYGANPKPVVEKDYIVFPDGSRIVCRNDMQCLGLYPQP